MTAIRVAIWTTIAPMRKSTSWSAASRAAMGSEEPGGVD